MSEVSERTVKSYFDADVRSGRRLLPDKGTVSGLGSWLKYDYTARALTEDSITDILDVGCNNGSLEYFVSRQYPHVFESMRFKGVDISEEAIASARQLGFSNTEFQSYEGRTLPFSSDSFDAVVLIEVVEHVIDKRQLLSEVRRVLRPQGIVLVTTPNPRCTALQFETAMWRVLRGLFGRPPLQKDIMIERERLFSMMEDLGFERDLQTPSLIWPHAFVSFLGWSLFPPLPPGSLLYYQKAWLRRASINRNAGWMQEKLFWTTLAHFRNGHS